MITVHRVVGQELRSGEGVQALTAVGTGEPVWVEAVAPSDAESAELSTRFGLHELAIQDALSAGHPPKLEEFEDHLFLIAHTPDRSAEESTRKLAVFLARNWIVTVLRTPQDQVDEVCARVRRDPVRFLKAPSLLAHALLDQLTDRFEALLDALRDEVEAIEERIELEPAPDLMACILGMRRELSTQTRVVRAQRDVLGALARGDHPMIPARMRPYMRDVYDHLLRACEQLESLRDALGAVRDALLSAINNRLGEVMRVLTVIATIMMPLSLLAGIFGMNFSVMPGTRHPAGFWILMAAMAGIAVFMLTWFRRRRWI